MNSSVDKNSLYNLLPEDIVSKLEQIKEKFIQVLVNKDDKLTVLLITPKSFYIISDDVILLEKSDVSLKPVQGTPNGKVIISYNGQLKEFNNIFYGRVYDFCQELKPKSINLASYDFTIRGEFPRLIDPDHAIENDRLRRYMQEGNISHYQFDDANPSYPKAGK